MTENHSTSSSTGRRSFLVRAIVAVQAAIGASVAFVVGATTLAPSFFRRDDTWLQAAELDSLPENQPVPVTLRVTRSDGYSQVVDRTVVYLVRTSERDVRALQSTCTHLGCRTAYDRKTKRILCPCHGGVFDAQGNVLEGPPPSPLPSLATRIEGGTCSCRCDDPRAVRLAGRSHRPPCRASPSARRAPALRHRLGVHHRQRAHSAAGGPVRDRRRRSRCTTCRRRSSPTTVSASSPIP